MAGLDDLQALRDAFATRLGSVGSGTQIQSLLSGLSEQPKPSGTFQPIPLAANPYAGGTGWKSTLTPAEHWILMHESGLNPTAQNPTSTAFGIWQGLESTRKHYLGSNYQTTDPNLQLDAFRRYVGDRYGTAEKAQAFWQKNHWY